MIDKELLVALFFLLIPTLPALIHGSIIGSLIAAIIGAVAVFVFLQNSLLGFGIYVGAVMIAWMFGASAQRRRRAERHHRELLRALKQRNS